MDDTETFTLHHSDFTLDESESAVASSFREFFERHCPSTRVRESAVEGWDPKLWSQLAQLRVVEMSLPEARGGDGGGLVELALACEEAGRAAAPAPLVETTVVARLLARCGSDASLAALSELLAGGPAAFAPQPLVPGQRALVPAAAAASLSVGLCGSDLKLVSSAPVERVNNLADAPVGWLDFTDGVVLASGAVAAELFHVAEAEWRLLTAAALVGLGSAALALGVQYAKEREAFGVPIGTFQALAHPLVDVAIALEGARRLTRKACWLIDRGTEPDHQSLFAFIRASEAAELAGQVSIHVQGGFGFTLESDVQLYYRRAKGWSLLGGDRRRLLLRAGRELFVDQEVQTL